jgi:hypothetical protein
MIPTLMHPLNDFDFRPNFKPGKIHCEFEVKSTLPHFKNYFHDIIHSSKIIQTTKPYVWFKNKKGKNNIFHLLFYNFKLVSRSEWHLEIEPKNHNFTRSLNSNNIFAVVISFFILFFDIFIQLINLGIFKIVFLFRRNKLNDASERFGLAHDSRKIIEKQSDIDGRIVYVKSRRDSFVSYDKILSSYITYDANSNLYIEELTISYIGYEGLAGPVPTDEKMKLVVYPYYENKERPEWFNNLKDDWFNCLIFDVNFEDRLKYIVTKDLNNNLLF